MHDLGTQLRDYMNQVVERADVDTLPKRLEREGPLPVPVIAKPPRPGWVIAIAAAIVTLLLIGGSNVLFNAFRSTPPADEVTTTTQAAAEEESTPTTQVVTAPTVIDEVTVDVASSVVPGLGTLKWEQVQGDDTTLPTGIEADPDVGYVSYEGTQVWRSVDALSWTQEEAAPEFADYRWVWFRDGWAVASNEDEGHLYEEAGDGWARVELPDAPFPETAGITWQPRVEIPITAGDARLIDGTTSGWVSWSDIYGKFEINCGEPEPCEMDPWAEWDSPSGTFRIQDPNSGSNLAVLTATTEGDSVVFVDTGTSETVHSVTGSADLPAEEILASMKRSEGVVFAGGWVSVGDSPWVWTSLPGQGQSRAVAVPDGGFAIYDFVYDWLGQPSSPFVSATVWTSEDGLDWIDQGEPAFVDESAEHMQVSEASRRLRATVITGYNDAAGMEEFDSWESTDGITWVPVDSIFPSWSQEHETNFGRVITSMPQSTHLFWVSTDGSDWHEVLGSPGSHEPAGAGYSAAGALGDILWTAVGENSGSRTLWIGRFEPEQ